VPSLQPQGTEKQSLPVVHDAFDELPDEELPELVELPLPASSPLATEASSSLLVLPEPLLPLPVTGGVTTVPASVTGFVPPSVC
jgi:hypothetical protein